MQTAITDRQSRRLLRPLLACLATKSAAEAGSPVNLYGGHFSFKRPGPNGPVWILGRFENRPGNVRVTLRRSSSPPENSEAKPGHRAHLPTQVCGATLLPRPRFPRGPMTALLTRPPESYLRAESCKKQVRPLDRHYKLSPPQPLHDDRCGRRSAAAIFRAVRCRRGESASPSCRCRCCEG